MWTVCHLKLRFSGPEAPLGLVVESGHLEAGQVTTAMRVESRIPGMRSGVSKQPWGRVWNLRVHASLQKPRTILWRSILCHKGQRWK